MLLSERLWQWSPVLSSSFGGSLPVYLSWAYSYVCILQVVLIMDSEEIPTFSSPKEETAYWKELSLKYKQRYCCRFAGWIWFLITRTLFNLFLCKAMPRWVLDILGRISAIPALSQALKFPALWELSVSCSALPCHELQAMFQACLSKSRALLGSCASLYN